jgi:hypothetical protein
MMRRLKTSKANELNKYLNAFVERVFIGKPRMLQVKPLYGVCREHVSDITRCLFIAESHLKTDRHFLQFHLITSVRHYSGFLEYTEVKKASKIQRQKLLLILINAVEHGVNEK